MNHKKKLEEAVVEEERKLKQRQQELSDDSGYDDSMPRDSAIELLGYERLQILISFMLLGMISWNWPASCVTVIWCAIC